MADENEEIAAEVVLDLLRFDGRLSPIGLQTQRGIGQFVRQQNSLIVLIDHGCDKLAFNVRLERMNQAESLLHHIALLRDAQQRAYVGTGCASVIELINKNFSRSETVGRDRGLSCGRGRMLVIRPGHLARAEREQRQQESATDQGQRLRERVMKGCELFKSYFASHRTPFPISQL